ncbi:lipopolysaccharide biosynthesis protein [Halorubrum sp. CSM-61]|uniref:lipopolysaccharide biosynthesis protein n=1 Tax=Halorubrum sp. CSM-61 TaxID=2485838 RepID=UPI000F4D184D|nr:oligosaccharide flippase family protein [Halorubrum sp. CSM-61]
MSEKSNPIDVSLGQEALSATTAKIASTVVGFLGTIVFARILGPTGFGAFFLLLTISNIAIRPLVGWATASKKRFSERKTEQQRSEIVGTQFILTAVFSLGLLGLSLVGAERLIEYTGLENAPVLFVMLAATSGLMSMLEGTTQARGKVGVTTWAGTLREGIAVPIQIALVVSGLGVLGMVFGHVFALLATIPIFLYYTDAVPSMPSREIFEDLWSYARHSIPNSFIGKIYNDFDIILLGFLLSPDAVGLYQAAFRVAAPATFVSNASASTLLPRVSNIVARGEDPRVDIRNTVAYASIFGFPIVFGSLAVSDKLIVTIYGSDFAGAVPLLIGLAIHSLFRTQTQVLGSVARGFDRPDVLTRLSLFALVVNILLGVILTLKFGAIGVVVATIVAELIRYVGLVQFTRQHVSWESLYPRPMIEQFGASLIMFGVVIGLKEVLTVGSVIRLGVVILAGAAIYFGILFAISGEHRTTFLSALEGFLGRPLPMT